MGCCTATTVEEVTVPKRTGREKPRTRLLAAARLGLLPLRSFLRTPLTRAALGALLLIPLMYSGTYLWSFWDPFERAQDLPVALVNEDRAAVLDGEEVDIGDTLTEELLDRGDLDWHLVDAQEAAEGVDSGQYYVSFTIPPHFSESLTSPSRESEDPTSALMVAHYNDANGYIVRQLVSSAFKEIRESAAQEATNEYFDQIFIGFSEIHSKTEEAAEGAFDLSAGADDAEEGSGELSEGADQAHRGAGELSEGLSELLTGSQELAAGTESASEEVDTQVGRLDEFTEDWQPFVEEELPVLQERVESVAEISDELAVALEELPEESHTEELTELDQRMEDFLENNPDLSEEHPEVHAILVDVQDGVSTVLPLASFIDENRSKIDEVAETATTVSTTASTLAEDLPDLVEDVEQARERVGDLTEGLDSIATGAGDLRDGLETASTGADDLDEGLGDLNGGASQLYEGLGQLAGGADELAEGLDEGTDEIPNHSDPERADLADMMSEPISLSSDIDNEAPDYGTGFAPFFVPLSLWVGAMMVFMVLPALSTRALSSSAPSWRVTLAGWVVPLLLGAGQVLVMLTVLNRGLGLSAPDRPALIGFLLLTSAAFTATVQYLNVRFGSSGRVVALVLLILQLTSAGGTYPIETSPSFFQKIGPYLPLYWAVTAMRRLLAEGVTELVLQAALVMSLWLIVPLVLSWITVARKRTWAMNTLHPALKL